MGISDIKEMSLKDLLAGVTVTIMLAFMGYVVQSDKAQNEKFDVFMNDVKDDILDIKLNLGDRWTRTDHGKFAKEQAEKNQQQDSEIQELKWRIQQLEKSR